MSDIIITDKGQEQPTIADMMLILREIRAQNERLLTRIDTLEREQTRRAAVVGFAGGILGGGIVNVGVALLRGKYGM
nr:MAG TPA: shock protein B [Caudoviricetes sp.]